jgi:protein gp37
MATITGIAVQETKTGQEITMTENSLIAWTDHTWNPWQGCRKVSAGCKNCYMFAAKQRYGQEADKVVRSKPNTFNQPLKYKDPARVFVCSWSDFFIDEADAWRDEAWAMMRRTPHLTYLLLTKRAANIEARLPKDWPLKNAWLGVTVENQDAIHRVDILRNIPAALRFLSVEPLLEQVHLNLQGIHWLITGCESSGNGVGRHVDLDAFLSLRDQCQVAGIPFFLKQAEIDGRLVREPFLDGVQYLEIPASTVQIQGKLF